MKMPGTLAVSAVAALLAVGVGAPNRAQAAEIRVAIDNFTFVPQQIKAAVGDTVIWANHDDIPHTATSTTKVFDSKVLDTNESFSFTFTSPGNFAYFCALHPHMVGSVLVEASAQR